MSVVVILVCGEGMSGVGIVHDQYVVEHLPADGADHPLAVSIHVPREAMEPFPGAEADLTRASSGIGAATARHLASLGAAVAVVAVAVAVDRFGRPDVLVGNAGIAKIGPVAELDVQGWSA